MSNIIKAIREIYPDIKEGVCYWESKQDGSPLDSPIDGLIWENTEFVRPTWDQIESKLGDIALKEAKDKKKEEIKALRKSNLLKSTPQTITYSGNLENKTFNINEGDLNTFTSIIGDLQDYNLEVDNEISRFLLTSNDIMIGQFVKQRDLNLYFKVIDLSNLDNELGYEIPTRTWGDITGERLLLDITDFKSLRKHLNLRDVQEYDHARLKIEAINLLTTIEEIEAFDITQVII